MCSDVLLLIIKSQPLAVFPFELFLHLAGKETTANVQHNVCVNIWCFSFSFVFTVGLSIDGALIEAHDVLSESSSLVTKDVFNLNKQFNVT